MPAMDAMQHMGTANDKAQNKEKRKETGTPTGLFNFSRVHKVKRPEFNPQQYTLQEAKIFRNQEKM